MAANKTTKIKRSEVDRWTGHAITNVSKNTTEQQKAIDEANAALKGKDAKKLAPKKK